MPTFEDFDALDIRVGQITWVEENPKARNPAYVIAVDLGKVIRLKQSIAQFTVFYKPKDLHG